MQIVSVFQGTVSTFHVSPVCNDEKRFTALDCELKKVCGPDEAWVAFYISSTFPWMNGWEYRAEKG